MSKFHSIVSRRDFMKGLGLAGAGLGAAAAAAPVFNDLSDLTSSPKANFRHPWWVKELEFEKPSVETDWSMMQSDWYRANEGPRNDVIVGYLPRTAEQQGWIDHFSEWRNERFPEIAEAGLKAGTPGYTLRDHALRAGAGRFGPGSFGPSTTWDGPTVTTPEARGVSKWTGTPEEATNMVRAVAHFYGCGKIGVLEITSNTRKLADSKKVRFEDVDVAYMDGAVFVIPNKARYAICYVVGQSTEMTKRGNTQQQMGADVGYCYGPIIQKRLQSFIKTLGYQALDVGSSTITNVAAGILSGTGELCRITHQITPEWGTMIRYTPAMITDLPLAPTKPIDAGMFRFCAECKTCATTCQEVKGVTPLSLETEPAWETTGPWNRAGIKAYHIKWGRCTYCPYCDGSCPFNGHGMSGIHEMVLAIQATTPIFNGLFVNMQEVFGYGLHDSPEYLEDWWDRDLNTWQHDVIFR